MAGKDDQIDALRKASAQKSADKRQAVIDALAASLQKGSEISIAAVAKAAGCSRKYIYSQPDLLDQIRQASREKTAAQRTEPNTDAVIKMLRQKIDQQDKQIKALEKALKESGDYKNKYLSERDKNKELRKQLEKAYKY